MIYVRYLIFMPNFFKANTELKVCHASRTRKMAKIYFRITRFVAKWICIRTVVAICVLEKSIPLNPLWILEHLSGIAVWEGIGWKIFEALVTAVYNYCLWTMITAQGYCLISDILISVLALSFCQHVAYK